MVTPTRAFALAVGVLAALAVAPAAARAGTPNPCSLGVGRPATYQHVVVIFEENDTYSKVIGSASAPYLNTLAADCALATNYHHDATVSQPNYMAVTGGNATGVGVHVNSPSIFSQAPSWVELEEGMSSNCGGNASFYKRGHDPAFWYTPLAAACKQFDVPLANSDAGAQTLPNPMPAYTFITPNLCHNHHWQAGCSEANTEPAKLAAMDTWLSGTVQRIAATGDYQAGRTLVLIAFDESGSTSTSQVPMVAVAGGVTPTRDGAFYDHYALLRASEEALGLSSFLGHAATAADMRPGMGF